MRPITPRQTGQLTLEDFSIYYEVFGAAEAPTVLLLPTWQIVHSRHWKMQIPYLSQYFQVVTFDAPGNGGGERTEDAAAFEYDRIVDQAVGLLDHLHVRKADVIGFSRGVTYGLLMAARYPERVNRLVLIGGGLNPNTQPASAQAVAKFWEPQEQYQQWGKMNANYWLAEYEDWLRFFFGQFFSEPHSTKGFEDCISWGLDTTPEILVHTTFNPQIQPKLSAQEILNQVQCPVLVIHGAHDAISDLSDAQAMVEARPDFGLVVMEDSGHAPHVRDAVRTNALITEFLGAPQRKRQIWRRALSRPRRALFISSPIGLGHVQRDLAVARELREQVPNLEIHWWAQHPVTQVLEAAGEFIHPLSRKMASESGHWEEESSGHGLHAFYAFRQMDEIFLYNFMLFQELVKEEQYDVWIGDESWEVDYYLHENPELKTAPYVFMTDVIGFLPVSSDPWEAHVCADYNAEMIEQRARFPRLRDLSLYVGEFDELPDETFGPELPNIRAWAREWFEPVGYIVPFDPAEYRNPKRLRAQLGYHHAEPLIFAAVGGTSVGRNLLQKIAEAFPLLQRSLPDARMVMVTGPRIDPAELPEIDGTEKRQYVHNLYEHLASSDVAVVQGGLTTTMELVAARRPFVYFPLHNHWEQLRYVAPRLDHYRAGVRLDYASTSPASLAGAIINALADSTGYRNVPTGAARRAATRIASLL